MEFNSAGSFPPRASVIFKIVPHVRNKKQNGTTFALSSPIYNYTQTQINRAIPVPTCCFIRLKIKFSLLL